MMIVHPQLRVVRLAMVLVIFVLTVFLYASYYASPGLSLPNRIHMVSSASGSSSSSVSISGGSLTGNVDFDATSAQLVAASGHANNNAAQANAQNSKLTLQNANAAELEATVVRIRSAIDEQPSQPSQAVQLAAAAASAVDDSRSPSIITQTDTGKQRRHIV